MSIAYRGASYAIGQGPQFYGIWHATAPQGAPLEWWPLTPEGWTGAWSRFASIEVPGTIAPASMIPAPSASPPPSATQAPNQALAPAGAAQATSQTSPVTGTPAPAAATETPTSQTSLVAGTPAPSEAAEAPAAVAGGPSGTYAEGGIDPQYGQVVARTGNPASVVRNSRIGAALLALGVVLGVIGLFPDYFTGASLAAQSAELVPHIIYLAAWAAGAVLVLYSGVRRQAGALIAAGVSVVTFGLFFADLGTPIAYGGNLLGAGLILSLVGWLACAAGAVLACAASGLTLRGRRAGSQRAGRLAGHEVVPTVVMILAAIGAAVAFAPSWDSYLLQTGLGTSATTTAGNALSNPGVIIFGDVAVMVLLVGTLVAAALWRPIRLGAALAVGAIIPMMAQGISALVQVTQPTSPRQLGYTQAQASELGLRITNGLTPMFWVYCAFLGTLILLCVWMLLSQDSAPDRAASYPGFAYTGQPYLGQPYPGQPHQGQPYQGQPYQGQPYQGQPYQGQPYQGQPYQGQPYPGQPHQGQPYQGQPYQGQPYQGQPYSNSTAAPSDAAPEDPGGPSVPPHTAPQA
jgi:hypothetical protein